MLRNDIILKHCVDYFISIDISSSKNYKNNCNIVKALKQVMANFCENCMKALEADFRKLACLQHAKDKFEVQN